jgi:hypothetical protein
MAFTNTVYTLIIEAYLETDSERRAGHRLGAFSTCIVRRTEEPFLAAKGGTVSLAMTSALGRQKPHTTHLEAVNRNSRLASAPPGAKVVGFVVARTLGSGRLRPYR